MSLFMFLAIRMLGKRITSLKYTLKSSALLLGDPLTCKVYFQLASSHLAYYVSSDPEELDLLLCD